MHGRDKKRKFQHGVIALSSALGSKLSVCPACANVTGPCAGQRWAGPVDACGRNTHLEHFSMQTEPSTVSESSRMASKSHVQEETMNRRRPQNTLSSAVSNGVANSWSCPITDRAGFLSLANAHLHADELSRFVFARSKPKSKTERVLPYFWTCRKKKRGTSHHIKLLINVLQELTRKKRQLYAPLHKVQSCSNMFKLVVNVSYELSDTMRVDQIFMDLANADHHPSRDLAPNRCASLSGSCPSRRTPS